jgi:hypothetical protein
MAERDLAFGGLVEAGDAVEHRGLAGAVGADQRGDLVGVGFEGEIRDGGKAAETHRHVLDREHRGLVRGSHVSRVLP